MHLLSAGTLSLHQIGRSNEETQLALASARASQLLQTAHFLLGDGVSNIWYGLFWQKLFAVYLPIQLLGCCLIKNALFVEHFRTCSEHVVSLDSILSARTTSLLRAVTLWWSGVATFVRLLCAMGTCRLWTSGLDEAPLLVSVVWQVCGG